MKRDSIWAFLVGILLTLLGVLAIDEVLFPNDMIVFLVPTSAVMIFLWLNGYRIARKKKAV